MNKCIICVACHDRTRIPDIKGLDENIYTEIESGASLRNGHFLNVRDDMGENISSLNRNYCELTALYFAYMNLDFDTIGLVHYRRFLKGKNGPLSREEIDDTLNEYQIILPKRVWVPMTNGALYYKDHTHEAMDVTREILKEEYPQYSKAFEKSLRSTLGYYFNIFIARKEIADGYLEWLFEVLKKVEQRIDLKNYTGQNARVFGYLGERLINAYVKANNLTHKDFPVRELKDKEFKTIPLIDEVIQH